MDNSVIFIMSVLGVTNIIVESHLFYAIRNYIAKYSNILKCHQCTGFWVGVFISIIFPRFIEVSGSIFLNGIISSLLCHLYFILRDYIETYLRCQYEK